MKHKYITQNNSNDCAAACLFNIIKYHGGNINLSKLNNMLNTNKEGTSIYDLVTTSNNIGLISSAYKCELNDLCDLDFPIIAHVKVEKKYNHFIIVDGIIDDEIIIFDPMSGYMKLELEEFEKYWSNIIITFKKTNSLINEKEKNMIKDFLPTKQLNIFIILSVLLFSIILSFLHVINSFYLSYLYDNQNHLSKIFIIFIFISIFTFIIDYIRNHIILKYTKEIDNNITCNTYRKILSLPILYHHNKPVGDIVSRINDLSNIKEFISNISFSFIVDIIYIIFISIVLFLINKILFIILFSFTLIYILVYILYRNNIRTKSLINKENASISSTFLVESLLSIDTIKNTDIENNIYEDFNKKYNKFLDSNFILNRLIINLNLIQNFISSIASIILIFVGIILYKNNIISLSYVITFNSLVIYYYISIRNIISLDEIIIEAKNSFIRISNLFNKPQIKNKNIKINNINNISFNNLKYSYNGINNILNNINITINKNDYVFVNGKSGVGKSTIFKLLTKQLDVNREMIKINNIDVNDISIENIVNNICYVSQNEYIFTDTILNNIKLYKDISEKDIEKVIKITGLDKVLENRNIDLNFTLQENAHNLSGGERQRIILTRSLLQNKKVLILDETMNEIDLESERNIIKKIKKEYKITLILISHRDNNSDLFNKIIKV